MYADNFYRLVVALVVTLGLVVAPALAFAQPDTADEPVAADTAVTIDDMTLDNQAHTGDETTFQQREDTGDNPGLARTVGLNALWGGITGGLIGAGVFLLTGMDMSPWIIAQFAGGGVLVGGTVGLIAALTRADEPETRALDERPDSVDWVQQQAPKTFEVPVLRGNF